MALNVFDVFNLVIIFMRPHEADKHFADGELDDYNQSIVIAFNVEHIVLIANRVYTVERFLYVGEASPLCPSRFFEPVLQWNACLGFFCIVVNQTLSLDDVHDFCCISVCKGTTFARTAKGKGQKMG